MLASLPSNVLDVICHILARPSASIFRFRPRDERRTLASLARTSRALHEPAVNAIWDTIPGISAILHILPDDLWIETSVPTQDPLDIGYTIFEMTFSFKRQPVQTDFTRLQHYAHRIQHITQASLYLISSDTLDALIAHLPAGTLFPNIQSLQYSSTASYPYSLLPLLVGPKMRKLRLIGPAPSQIDAEHPNADPLDCLRVLPRVCLVLSELIARMDLETEVPNINVISEVIPGFPVLTTVHVPGIPLDFPAILHLARLPNLKTLIAYVSPGIPQKDYNYLTSTSAGGQKYFPNLQRINLKNLFLAFSTSLLKVISSPVLEAVTFTTVRKFGFYCTSEDVSELCAQLSRHPTLTSITIAVGSLLNGSRLTRTTFAPLLALSELTVLDVDISHDIHIDDAFLAEMAHAWRKLIRLKLCVRNPFWSTDGYDPAATVLGLLPFARLCPALEDLGIPVSADLSCLPQVALERRPFPLDPNINIHGNVNPEFKPEIKSSSKSESVMCSLEVGLSVVRAPWVAPVAAFLSDLFPELTAISSAWTDEMGEDMDEDMDGPDVGTPAQIRARWDEVALLALRFGNVRRQERNWVAVHRDA